MHTIKTADRSWAAVRGIVGGVVFIGCTQLAAAQTDLDLRLGDSLELNIGGTPNLVLGGAFDFNGDGADDLLYHNLGLPVSPDHYHLSDLTDYTFLYGAPAKPFDQDGKLVIGVDRDLEPVAFVPGDFNEDGITDFVGGSGNTCGADETASNSVPVFFGEGEDDPQLEDCLPIAPPHLMGSATGSKIEDIQLEDFNGDGHHDVVVHRSNYSYDSFYLVVYLGNGDGTFGGAQFVDITQPIEYRLRYWFRHGWVEQGYVVTLEDLRSIDYDGDGDLDFVLKRLVAGQNEHELFIYENDGEGVFELEPVIVPPVETVAQTNTILTYPEWYLTAIRPSAWNEDITYIVSELLGVAHEHTVTRDFDGDGIDDFAISAPTSLLYPGNALYVFFGIDGTAYAYDPYILPLDRSGQRLLTAGDFDADGTNDLLLVEPIPEWQGNTVITPVFNTPAADGGTATGADTGTNTDTNTGANTDTTTDTNTGGDPTGTTPPAIEPDAEEVEFNGTITEVGGGYLVVDSTTVWITEETKTTTEGDVPFGVGQEAQAQGFQNSDGAVIGTNVEAW